MDLTDIAIIKFLCKQFGLYPSRERGQNFLISRDVLDDMIAAADLKKDDIVLEVGPGFGVLTLELAKRVKKVVAVEQDKILIKALQENLAKEQIKNVEIVEGDILKLPTTHYQLLTTNYRIVSNLPYQITSRFLRIFLSAQGGCASGAETEPKPQDMTIMVQKEVAERICAEPGDMSLLAVSVQFYAEPEIIRNVFKDCFWPEPEVDSAILKITLKTKKEIMEMLSANVIASETKQSQEIAAPRKAGLAMTEANFFKIVRNGFLHRRQKLANNLSNIFHLDKNKLVIVFKKMGISENARAQELSVDQWIDLAKEILSLGSRMIG